MDASDRRAIPEDAVLRQPEDGQGIGHQPPQGAASDAADGLGGDLPKPHLSRSDAEHRIYRFQVLIKLSWAGLLPQGSYNRFQGRFVCIIFLFPRFLA